MFEFVVVGKGLMGSAAARHLAEAGREVALIGPDEPIDRTAHSGVFGSHYDSGRIVRVLDRDPLWATLAQSAIARFREQEAATRVPFFSEVGVLFVAPADAAVSDYLPALEKTAASVHALYERVGVIDLTGFVRGASFRSGCAGLFQRRHAGHIDPRQHLLANITAIRQWGGNVRNDRVLRIETTPEAVLLHAEKETLRARQVIVATGAYTNAMQYPGRRLHLWAETWSVLLARVEGEEIAALRAMPCVLYKPAAPEEHAYVLPPIRYPDGGWYLKIGWPFSHERLVDLTHLTRWFQAPVPEEMQTHLARLLRALFPDIRFASLHCEPCCTTHTPSGYPYIDFADNHRIIWLVGCNGYAGKSADELGRLAARLVLDGRWTDSLDPHRFRAQYV